MELWRLMARIHKMFPNMRMVRVLAMARDIEKFSKF